MLLLGAQVRRWFFFLVFVHSSVGRSVVSWLAVSLVVGLFVHGLRRHLNESGPVIIRSRYLPLAPTSSIYAQIILETYCGKLGQ